MCQSFPGLLILPWPPTTHKHTEDTATTDECVSTSSHQNIPEGDAVMSQGSMCDLLTEDQNKPNMFACPNVTVFDVVSVLICSTQRSPANINEYVHKCECPIWISTSCMHLSPHLTSAPSQLLFEPSYSCLIDQKTLNKSMKTCLFWVTLSLYLQLHLESLLVMKVWLQLPVTLRPSPSSQKPAERKTQRKKSVVFHIKHLEFMVSSDWF